MALIQIEPYVIDITENFTFNNVTATGNLSSLNANIGNVAVANFFTGTLTTASQPNITSVGTLTSLDVAGNINAGNISTSGSGGNITGANVISANTFIGSGNNLSNIQGANVTGAVSSATSATTAGTVTTAAQPNITSVGTLTGFTSNGVVNFTNASNVTLGAVGNVRVTGGSTGQYLQTDGSGTLTWATINTGIPSNIANGNSNVNIPSANGNVNISAVGNANVVVVTGTGANINGYATISGTVTAGNISTSGSGGNITGANVVSANIFTGSGNNLSNIQGANVTGAVGLATYATTANAVAGANVSGAVSYATTANSVAGANVTGQVGNALVAGTVYTGAQPNITSVGTLTSLTATGNVTGGNLVTAGKVYSSEMLDGGTGIYLAAGPSGYINFFTTGGDKASISDTGNIIASNVIANSTVFATTANISGNVTAGNANLGNLVTANFFSGNGSLLTGITSATVTTNAQPNITSVGTLTGLTVTGNSTINNVSLTGNIIPSVTNTYSLGNATHYFKDAYIGPGSLYVNGKRVLEEVSGTINFTTDINQNLKITTSGAGDILFDPTGTGVISIKGPLQIEAGTNITSSDGNSIHLANPLSVDSITTHLANTDLSLSANGTGTIKLNDDVTVSGNLTVSGTTTYINTETVQIYDNIIDLNSNFTTGSPTENAGIRVLRGDNAAVSLRWNETTDKWQYTTDGSAYDDIVGTTSLGVTSLGNSATANYFTGNGSLLTSITGGNITGQVGNALIAGTVYTNAQPNITSVGTLTSLDVTGNITGGNANLGNAVVSNFFVGSGAFLTSVTAVTAGTVTTNAQPNITSVGLLTSLVVGNATANSTFGNGNITASGNISFTGANVSLGDASNLKITGGSSGYFLTTDGAGNLSWGAASGGGGGGVSATGSNTQLQFNDGGALGASVNLTFNKATNTFATARITASNGANLGSNVANVYIGGGSNNQILKTDGSGNLSWIAQPATTITVDNFTGDGTTVAFTLTASPTSINQTAVNYNGTLQLRAAYTVSGSTLTFSEAPVNGSLIEVTTTLGVMSGAGAFVTRSYTGNGVQSTFSVTSGCTVSSVIVTENGLVQVPTVDYTISGSTLTFNGAPANGIIINIRELAIATATGGGSAITVQDEGSNLTTTASLLNFVGAGVTTTNSGSNVTVTIPSGGTSAAVAFGYSLVFGG